MPNKTRSKSKKKNQNSKITQPIRLLIAGLLLPALGIYVLVSIYYNNHFYNNTIINGVSVSNMTLQQAEDSINSITKAYFLTLEGRGGISDTIDATEINLHTVLNDNLTGLFEKQNGLKWPLYIFESQELTIETMLVHDESLLKVHFDRLIFFNDDNNIEPVNAHISEYTDTGYMIIPEIPGAKVIKNKLYDAVKEAVLHLAPSLSLEEINVYEKPELTSQYPAMLDALNELNRIAGTKITYEFGDVVETLDGSLISEWLSVDEHYQVTFEEEKVKEYVDYIGKTYNSFGKTRTFQTSYKEVIEIKGGDYGWWLNRGIEVSELTELILNGEQLIREPVYYQTAQQYGENDIGDTYVEVNLTAQHLFFYLDGELIVETDFVSGNLKKDYGTPTGTYPIQYKDYEATLTGEDYATPVKYWMPFNGNIGFHDAYWRKEFGKDIYLTSGSHGCINMPPKTAKKMYENISRGVAVFVYELPGTENYEIKEEDITILETPIDAGV